MRTRIIVSVLLTVFFLLALFSSLGDSNTMDEVAHTPAGYSYIVKRDMRLNPEHPPLLKDAAGLSVWLGAKISGTQIAFNDQHSAWAKDINGQWEWGFDWLFGQGNPADRVIFWARLPMMLLGVLFGWYIFRFGKEFFGPKTALLALFFYAFSPTFLAHTRLVTTDVGAAFGFFIAIMYFLKWWRLRSKIVTLPYPRFAPEREEARMALLKAGLAFGLAQLLKFSTFLLIPYFIALVMILIFAESMLVLAPWATRAKHFLKNFGAAFGSLIAIIAIGYALVWPVYAFHVAGYPPEQQRRDTESILISFAHGPPGPAENACNPFAAGLKRTPRCAAELTIWASDKSLLRPYAQYMLGLLMVIQRSTGGNTTYFLGEISKTGWRHYFPIVYALKETLALHVFTTLALILSLYHLVQRRPRDVDAAINSPSVWRGRLARWIGIYPAETAMLSFIALYWSQSISSHLNIGVRHILPTLPFIFLLVSRQIARWLSVPEINIAALGIFRSISHLFAQSIKIVAKYALTIVLVLWAAGSTLAAFPHYLPYFNGLVGTDNGYRVVVDSNYDWGQDLKRLARFVEKRNIDKIKVYYFGGSTVEYYLGERYEPLYPERGPQKGWLAVSATLLQGGRGKPAPNFDQPTGHFNWLNDYEPVARAGKSIFIYYIP